MDSDELKTIINEVLDERDSFAGRTHSEHHLFVEAMIEREKRKQERVERLRQQVTGWGVITLLGGIGYGAYHLLIEFIHKVSH